MSMPFRPEEAEIMAEALRELGYTVIAPAPPERVVLRHNPGDPKCIEHNADVTYMGLVHQCLICAAWITE